MPHYKDLNGGLHFLGDAAFRHLLPDDCVEITDEEAATLRAPTKAQRIAQVSVKYDNDCQALCRAWTAASLIEGAAEVSAKASITQQFAARKSDYKAEVSAIRSE